MGFTAATLRNNGRKQQLLTFKPSEDKHRWNISSLLCYTPLSALLCSTINGICHWLHTNLWNSAYQKSNIPLLFHPLLHLFLSGNQEENDAAISPWLVGLGAQPWRQRLMMYLCMLTFWVCHPAVYLPHLDQPSECLFMWWVEERLCMCLYMFHIWGQDCAADAHDS